VPKTLKIVVEDAEGARIETRRVLDEFEARYGLPSERLMEVFLGPDGHVDESANFHAWDSAWTSWQILTGR
jgi:hypothetical protein